MKTFQLHWAVSATLLTATLITSTLVCAQPAAPVQETTGKGLSCETLKQTITDKLEAKGVKNYQLDIVDSAGDTTAKVVGQCDGGKHKITYLRESGAVTAK